MTTESLAGILYLIDYDGFARSNALAVQNAL